MDALQTLAITAFATLVSSVLTAFFTKIIETKHSKELEMHKSQIQSQLEQAKLELENEWQRKFFEYQTKFSSFHQEQAEKIREIYGLLFDTQQSIGYQIGPYQPLKNSPESKALAEETNKKYQLLFQSVHKNRIYFDEETADQIEAIVQKMHRALRGWAISETRDAPGRSAELALEAWNAVEKDIPPLLKELERQFRQALMPSGFGDSKKSE